MDTSPASDGSRGLDCAPLEEETATAIPVVAALFLPLQVSELYT